MRRIALALLLSAALAPAACGGGEDDEDTTAQDTEAIENLVVAYGLSDDAAEGCQLYSSEYLAGEGEGCLSEKWVAVQFTVEDVSLDGDFAYITVVREDGQQMTGSLHREGGPGDAYSGWKFADDLYPVPSKDDAAAPETEASAAPETEATSPEAESAPQTQAEKVAAYTACVEGRGAKNVKQSGGGLPSVDFSGGGSRVNAVFGADEADAEQGLASIKGRKPFFAERYGTIVLYSVGDPLADDVETGIGCAEETG